MKVPSPADAVSAGSGSVCVCPIFLRIRESSQGSVISSAIRMPLS